MSARVSQADSPYVILKKISTNLVCGIYLGWALAIQSYFGIFGCMNRFATTKDVVTALGGTDAVAKMFNVTSQAVSVWRVRGHFPPHTFSKIQTELLMLQSTADLSLWNWERPAKKQA